MFNLYCPVVSVRLYHQQTMIFPYFLKFSYGFPMIFYCFLGFPMIFLYFPNFPMVKPALSSTAPAHPGPAGVSPLVSWASPQDCTTPAQAAEDQPCRVSSSASGFWRRYLWRIRGISIVYILKFLYYVCIIVYDLSWRAG